VRTGALLSGGALIVALVGSVAVVLRRRRRSGADRAGADTNAGRATEVLEGSRDT